MTRSALLFAFSILATTPSFAALEPHQARALEQILADMPESMRDAMRPQLEASLTGLTEAQVGMLMEQYTGDAEPESDEDLDAGEIALSPEDDDWNRRQIDGICARMEQATLTLRAKAAAKQQELAARYQTMVAEHGEYRLLGSDRWGDPLQANHSPAMLKAIAVNSAYEALGAEERRRFDFSAVPFPDEAQVLAAMERSLAEVEAIWKRFEAEYRDLNRTHFDDVSASGHSDRRQQQSDAIHARAEQALQGLRTPQQIVDAAIQAMYNAAGQAVLMSETQ